MLYFFDFFNVLSAGAGESEQFAFSLPMLWAIVTFLTIIVEISTVSLVSIWFLPGSVAALVASFIPGCPLWVQIILFSLISVICFSLFRKKFKEKIGKSKIATNADIVIGQTGIITENISNIEGKGVVKVMGKEWSARSETNSDILVVGDLVTVVKIEGVKLICKKQTKN